MKFSFSAFCLLLCVSLLAQNILENPSFAEEGRGWDRGIGENVSLEGDVVSLRGDAHDRCYLLQQGCQLIPGAVYRFTVEYRSDDGARGLFYFERATPAHGTVQSVQGTPQWQTEEFLFTPQPPTKPTDDCVYYAVLSVNPGETGVLQFRNPEVTLVEESLSALHADADNLLPEPVLGRGGWRISDPAYVSFPQEGVARVIGRDGGRSHVGYWELPLQDAVPYTLTFLYRGTPGALGDVYFERVAPADFAHKTVVAAEEWRQATLEFTTKPGLTDKYYVVFSTLPDTKGAVEFANPVLERQQGVLVNGDFTSGLAGWESRNAEIVDFGGDLGAVAHLDGRFDSAWLRQSGLFVKKGKIYRLGYDVRGGEDHQYTDIQNATWSRIAVLDDQGQVIPGCGGWRDCFGNSWQHKEVTFVADRDMDVTLQGELKDPGIVNFDNITFGESLSELPLLEIVLDAPFAYHNGAREGDGATVFTGKIYAALPGTTLVVSFRGEEQVLSGTTPAEFSFPVPTELGEFPLKATLLDEQGGVLAEAEVPFTLRKKAARDFHFDENKVLHIDGKPIFPICSWGNRGDLPFREGLKKQADLGIDMVLVNRMHVDDVAEFGMMAIIGLQPLMELAQDDIYLEKVDGLRKEYAEVMKHPSMAMWYVTDEPAWRGEKAAPYVKAYERLLKYVDDEHPCFLNEAPRGSVQDNRPFSLSCDVYGVDIYPIPAPNSHSGLDDKMMTSVGKYTDICRDTVRDSKPIWMTLQGFAWGCFNRQPPAIYPTLQESRYMAYEAIAHGATGLFYWGLDLGTRQDDAFLADLKATIAEIHNFAAILVAPESRDVTVAGPGASQIRVCHKANAAGALWIVLNESDKKASFNLKGEFPQVLREICTGETYKAKANGDLFLTLQPYDLVVLMEDGQPLPEPQVMPKTHRLTEHVELPTDFTKASWIWYPGETQSTGSRADFRFTVTLDKPLEHAWLAISMDDAFSAIVNGKEVMRHSMWDVAWTADIAKELQVGENEIILRAVDFGAPCGALFALTLSDGRVILSDENIQVRKPGEDTWVPAKNMGKYGTEPWIGVEPALYTEPTKMVLPL